jgi:hypothetical protein
MESGLQQIRVTLPQLPLRPGTYSVLTSLYNGGNNRTGKMLAVWNGIPFLTVDTLPFCHPEDAWNGVLNLPAHVSCPGLNESAHAQQIVEPISGSSRNE